MRSTTKPVGARSRPRALVIGGFGAVLLLCLCLSAAVTVLGVLDPFNLYLLDRITGRYDAAATAMPPNTQFYLGVDWLALRESQLEQVIGPFGRALESPDVQDLDSALGEIDRDLKQRLGVTIVGNVLPWLGQYIGYGVLDLGPEAPGEVDQREWLLVAAIRDGGAATRFVQEFLENAAEATGSRFSEREYRGVAAYVLGTDAEPEQLAFSRAGQLMIFGSGMEAVQRAIDARRGDSLAANVGFREVIRGLPGGRAITAFVNGAEANYLANNLPGPVSGDLDLSALPVASFDRAGLAITIVGVGLQVDVVSAIEPQLLGEAQRTLFASARNAPEADELLPDSTLIFVAGHRLDVTWSAIKESLAADGRLEDLEQSMASFGNQFGINPDQELLPLLDGEWAIGILPGETGLLAEQLELPLGFVVLAGTSDAADVTNRVEALSSRLERQLLTVERIEVEGITFRNLKLLPVTNPLLSYGIGRNYLFVASGEDEVRRTFGGGPSLSATERYRQVWSEFPSNMVPAFYVNVRGLIEVLREDIPAEQSGELEDGLRILEPILAIAAADQTAQEAQRRSRIILFIEPDS